MPTDKPTLLSKTPVAPKAPPGYEIQNLPDFIRPANVGTKTIPSPQWTIPGLGKIIADVKSDNPHTIEVREPQLFAQPQQTHESTHVYQFSRNPEFADNLKRPALTSQQSYGYGGIEGLEQAIKNRKTINDFNIEQQADIVSDYQAMTSEALKRNDAKALARVTAAYHPFISQFARIPQKGTDMTRMTQQDLNPVAPGLPPATVIGVPLTADPLLGKTYTPAELKSMASQRVTNSTGPMVGDTKKFKSGKIGAWDGHGWRLAQ